MTKPRQLDIGSMFGVGMKLNSKGSISTEYICMGNHIRAIREASGNYLLAKLLTVGRQQPLVIVLHKIEAMAVGIASKRVSKDSVDQIYWAVTQCVYSGKRGSVDDNAAQASMTAAQNLEPVTETAETLRRSPRRSPSKRCRMETNLMEGFQQDNNQKSEEETGLLKENKFSGHKVQFFLKRFTRKFLVNRKVNSFPFLPSLPSLFSLISWFIAPVGS